MILGGKTPLNKGVRTVVTSGYPWYQLPLRSSGTMDIHGLRPPRTVTPKVMDLTSRIGDSRPPISMISRSISMSLLMARHVISLVDPARLLVI